MQPLTVQRSLITGHFLHVPCKNKSSSLSLVNYSGCMCAGCVHMLTVPSSCMIAGLPDLTVNSMFFSLCQRLNEHGGRFPFGSFSSIRIKPLTCPVFQEEVPDLAPCQAYRLYNNVVILFTLACRKLGTVLS